MKKLIIIAVLFALCGFGAFKHFASEKEVRNKLDQRTATAVAETESLTKKNAETRRKLETGKQAAEESLKKTAAEALATAREPHLKVRDELKAKLAALTAETAAAGEQAEAPVSEARRVAETELATVTAEIEAANARIAKLEVEQKTLKKFKDAEIAAMPPSRRAKVK